MPSCSFMMEYDIHTLLDLLTLAATVTVIYCMTQTDMRATYQREQDGMKFFMVVSCPCVHAVWCSSTALRVWCCLSLAAVVACTVPAKGARLRWQPGPIAPVAPCSRPNTLPLRPGATFASNCRRGLACCWRS